MTANLFHVHPDGFKERVLGVKEYRTYPPGLYPYPTQWAIVLRPRRGVTRLWQLVLVSELVIET